MSKKLHAKDLKKDELVETLGELWGPAVHWFEENRSKVIWGMVGLLGLALAIGALGSWTESRNEAARAALGAAMNSLAEAEAGVGTDSADAPSWDDVRAGFQRVADEHSGNVAVVARHFVGVAQLRGGDAAGAVATLEATVAKASDPWQKSLSLSVLAAAQEKAGDPAAAGATLERLRTESALGYPSDAATMDLARFHERQGRLDEARRLYAELAPEQDEDENDETSDIEASLPSVYAGEARARLDELEG